MIMSGEQGDGRKENKDNTNGGGKGAEWIFFVFLRQMSPLPLDNAKAMVFYGRELFLPVGEAKGGTENMKKLVALVMALMMALCATAALADQLSDIQAKGVLELGANIDFMPYEFYWTNPETGEEEVAGFDMALAQGIADKLGVKLEIRDQAFSGLVTALSAGEMDMVISGLAIKPERLEVVDFSDPYFSGEQILLVRAEDYDSLKTVEDMAGKKVGAQLGSLQQGILEEQFAASEPLLLEKIHILALELDQGNIDGWLITDLVAKQYMAVYPGRFQISEVPVVYDSSAGIGVAVPKGDNASLLAEVNAYIAEVKENGTFDAWVDEAAAKGASLLAAQEN